MKRTALRRRTPLKPGTSSLKRTELKRGGELKRTPMKRVKNTLLAMVEQVEKRWSTVPKVNRNRAAKARDRDFGPHGKVIIPRLPCAVCYPWFYSREDSVVREAMEEVYAEPERFAVVSEPAHVTHSRGAGGDRSGVAPLCNRHHIHGIHVDGVETFAAAHPDVDLIFLAARLWRLSPAREMENAC